MHIILPKRLLPISAKCVNHNMATLPKSMTFWSAGPRMTKTIVPHFWGGGLTDDFIIVFLSY